MDQIKFIFPIIEKTTNDYFTGSNMHILASEVRYYLFNRGQYDTRPIITIDGGILRNATSDFTYSKIKHLRTLLVLRFNILH